MTVAGQMLDTHPADLGGIDKQKLTECIEACFECAQSCTACADACLSEEMVAELTTCIRTNLDCADVFDTTGRYAFADLARILTPDGVLISTRPISRDALRLLRPTWSGGPRFTFVATKPRSQDLAHLVHLVDTGRLRVPLDRVFPADEAAAAHRHAQEHVTGKVVLSLP